MSDPCCALPLLRTGKYDDTHLGTFRPSLSKFSPRSPSPLSPGLVAFNDLTDFKSHQRHTDRIPDANQGILEIGTHGSLRREHSKIAAQEILRLSNL